MKLWTILDKQILQVQIPLNKKQEAFEILEEMGEKVPIECMAKIFDLTKVRVYAIILKYGFPTEKQGIITTVSKDYLRTVIEKLEHIGNRFSWQQLTNHIIT